MSLGALKKFLENGEPLIFRNSHPGVSDHDQQIAAAALAAEQDLAGTGIADCIGEKVAEDAAKQCRVGA